MKGQSLFDSSRSFYAVYDHVDGLSVSRPVTINGFKIGYVDKIALHPNGSGKLIVSMSITDNFAIAKNSIAKIESEDILGGRVVSLQLGNSLDLAKSGDTLQAEIQLTIGEEVNRQVAPLKDKAEKMIGSIDTVLTLMSGFLDDQTQDNFAEAFSSIKRSFEKLEETITVVNQTVGKTQGDFESIMKNVASITENLKNNGEELDGIFSNLEAISDSLSKVQFSETFASLKNSLETTESVLKKINEGDGSMAQLINNPELYEQLEQSSLQLNKLLKDIRYNPNRYIHFSVFGSSKTYTEEEIEEMENAAKEDE